MAGIGEGVGKTLGQAAIIGGLIAGLYLFRDQIAGWVKGLIPSAADYVGDKAEDFKEWAIDKWQGLLGDVSLSGDPDKSLAQVGIEWVKSLFPSGNLTDEQAAAMWLGYDQTKSELWASEQGVSHPLYTDDPIAFFANSAQIRAEHAPVPPSIRSYADVASFDTDKYELPGYTDFSTGGNLTADFMNPAGTMALSIEPTGWALLEKDPRYAGVNNPEGWRNTQGAGGGSAAVWVDPRLEQYLAMFVGM